MHRDISLNPDLLFLASGLSETELEFYRRQTQEAAQAVAAMERLNQLGFLHLEFLEDQVSSYRACLAALSFRPRYHVVLGIGGSSLGAKAILKALVPASTLLETIFLEGTDPVAFEEAVAGLAWESTLVTVVSKSGTTLETLALFTVVRERLSAALPDWRRHVLVITKEGGGGISAIARREGLSALAIPSAIGGRFSVLSAVGMVPALVAGVDVGEFFHGAKNYKRACGSDAWRENPALALALYQYVLHKKKGKVMTVLMPYAEALEGFTAWAAQLWAESIGKKHNSRGEEVREGFTPIRAMGSEDQHSQCQLYLEGPRDKWVLFLEVASITRDCQVPVCDDLPEDRKWIVGQSFSAIQRAQRKATAQALYEQGVPSATLEIPRLSPYTLGQLFFLYELQTAYMGALYGVNAFDQPGVERIKRLTVEMFKA